MQTDVTDDNDDERDTDDNRDTDTVNGATPSQASPQVSPSSFPTNNNFTQQSSTSLQNSTSHHQQQPTTRISATHPPEHTRMLAHRATKASHASHDSAGSDAKLQGVEEGSSANLGSSTNREGEDYDNNNLSSRPTSSSSGDNKSGRNASNSSTNSNNNNNPNRTVSSTPQAFKKRNRTQRSPPTESSPSQAPPPAVRPKPSSPAGPAHDDQQTRFDELIGRGPLTSEPEDNLGPIPLCSGPFVFGKFSSSNQSSSDNSLDSKD